MNDNLESCTTNLDLEEFNSDTHTVYSTPPGSKGYTCEVPTPRQRVNKDNGKEE